MKNMNNRDRWIWNAVERIERSLKLRGDTMCPDLLRLELDIIKRALGKEAVAIDEQYVGGEEQYIADYSTPAAASGHPGITEIPWEQSGNPILVKYDTDMKIDASGPPGFIGAVYRHHKKEPVRFDDATIAQVIRVKLECGHELTSDERSWLAGLGTESDAQEKLDEIRTILKTVYDHTAMDLISEIVR